MLEWLFLTCLPFSTPGITFFWYWRCGEQDRRLPNGLGRLRSELDGRIGRSRVFVLVRFWLWLRSGVRTTPAASRKSAGRCYTQSAPDGSEQRGAHGVLPKFCGPVAARGGALGCSEVEQYLWTYAYGSEQFQLLDGLCESFALLLVVDVARYWHVETEPLISSV